MSEEFIEDPQAKGPRRFARTLFFLQAALIGVVVLWVLDLQRSLFKLNLYTEQMLLGVLGLAIGICFLVTAKRHFLLNAAIAFAGVALCLYLA